MERQDHIKVDDSVIDVLELTRLVQHDSAGAISTFLGTTRDQFQGKKVLRLEYEGYVPMAEKEIAKICSEVRGRYPDIVHIAVYHRLGLVPIGETSVGIAVSSPHRSDAIEAAHLCIDMVKATVPIWKKEIYDEGEAAWKENSEFKFKATATAASATGAASGTVDGVTGDDTTAVAAVDEAKRRHHDCVCTRTRPVPLVHPAEHENP